VSWSSPQGSAAPPFGPVASARLFCMLAYAGVARASARVGVRYAVNPRPDRPLPASERNFPLLEVPYPTRSIAITQAIALRNQRSRRSRSLPQFAHLPAPYLPSRSGPYSLGRHRHLASETVGAEAVVTRRVTAP